MNYRPLLAMLSSGLVTAAFMAGCERRQQTVAPAKPPVIPVSKPVVREVTDYVDFTGQTDAVESVDIRPRVTGYLVKMPFKEGADVKKGELLFQVDPRPYKAQYDQAQGQVNLNQASLKLAKVTYARDLAIAGTGGTGAVSQQQLDQDLAAVNEAEARVKATEASLETYKLYLDFTNVTSPIDGQVSRYYLTLGNLVNADQTLLTRVVSLDPMYAYFDMDEPTLLRIKRAINEKRIPLPQPNADIPVLMGLQGEDGYPHRGTINFVNNQVNPSTGTISVRGVFANPKPPGGTRLLTPGMFVRIRLPIGVPHKALLVIDRALGSDQGLKYLYVVGSEHKVEYHRVTTGPLQDDGLRVILDGLKPDEWVVVGGLQQVRPNMVIEPEQMEMPTLGIPAAGETTPATPAPKPPSPQTPQAGPSKAGPSQ